MHTIYIFDMDGTLTPARLPMEEAFATKFQIWLKDHEAYIATGSDYEKVKEQLPNAIIELFSGIYCSMGNELRTNGSILYSKQIELEDELLQDLNNFREKTQYPHKLYANFLEKRAGMYNFSILGRNCPYEARTQYTYWDNSHKEREKIQSYLTTKYPQYDFLLGGTISIDIVKKSCGKGQIADHLRKAKPNSSIIFYGDKTFKGGNDYELACRLSQMENTKTIQIESANELLEILNNEAM